MRKTYFCKPAMFQSYNYIYVHCPVSRTIALNSRVLLGKLLVPQPLKKFTALYGTRKFITAFTTAHQFFVSWTTQIQCKSFYPVSLLSIRIWFSHLLLCLQSYLLPSGFPIKILHEFISFPTRTACPVRLSFLDLISLFAEYHKTLRSSLYSFLRPPATSSPLTSAPNSLTPSAYVLPLTLETYPKFSRTKSKLLTSFRNAIKWNIKYHHENLKCAPDLTFH
jgi:hypothetical protein